MKFATRVWCCNSICFPLFAEADFHLFTLFLLLSQDCRLARIWLSMTWTQASRSSYEVASKCHVCPVSDTMVNSKFSSCSVRQKNDLIQPTPIPVCHCRLCSGHKPNKIHSTEYQKCIVIAVLLCYIMRSLVQIWSWKSFLKKKKKITRTSHQKVLKI